MRQMILEGLATLLTVGVLVFLAAVVFAADKPPAKPAEIGECGSANGKLVLDYPAGKDACAQGVLENMRLASGQFFWMCAATSISQSCTAFKVPK
jgi:hypothetical protein